MIERELYMDILKESIDAPVIKVITGMRRCGKSMLLKALADELSSRGVRDKQIIFMNFESLEYADYEDYKSLYDHIITLSDKNARTYILLDEIQNVDGWEKAVNSFRVDLDCDIYITGSNSKLLSGELSTLIAGRYIQIMINPLTFKEYLRFSFGDKDVSQTDVRLAFSDYLQSGGMPGLFAFDNSKTIKDQYLIDMYNSIILKDVIQRNNLRSTELLDRIMKFVMDNIGNTFSAKNISDFVRSQGRTISNDTVHTFLKALEESFVISKVSRYDLKGKNHLKTQEKYFIADLGMRSALIGYRNDDISGMLENVVFNELRSRRYKVSIGKIGDKEIDFIAERNNRRIYIQVCYILSDEDVIRREFGPLEAIDDNYEKYVLSLDGLPEMNDKGIRRINIIDFIIGDIL